MFVLSVHKEDVSELEAHGEMLGGQPCSLDFQPVNTLGAFAKDHYAWVTCPLQWAHEPLHLW